MKSFYRACCALLLVLLCVALSMLWWSARWQSRTSGSAGPPAPPAVLVPFRTPGGTLHTNGFVKTDAASTQIMIAVLLSMPPFPLRAVLQTGSGAYQRFACAGGG